jgi:hypothetical protein
MTRQVCEDGERPTQKGPSKTYDNIVRKETYRSPPAHDELPTCFFNCTAVYAFHP